MLDDQRIRGELMGYADRVPVDVDADLGSVLDAASAREGRARRVALLAAVPLLVAVVVGALLLLTQSGTGQRTPAPPAAEATAGRLAGTWERSVVTDEGLPPEAIGTWTMVLGADGALTLVPPEAWSAQHSQPNGVYVQEGDTFRTNVLSSESCAGAAGIYSFTVDHTALDLSASTEPCALRAAILDARWERAP